MSAALRERWSETSRDDQPCSDGLLMLAPALIQVFAALSDAWPGAAQRENWLLGMGGQPDSCWMWRRGGALRGRPGRPRTHDSA